MQKCACEYNVADRITMAILHEYIHCRIRFLAIFQILNRIPLAYVFFERIKLFKWTEKLSCDSSEQKNEYNVIHIVLYIHLIFNNYQQIGI